MAINDDNLDDSDYLDDEDSQKDKYITFLLNKEEYAIEIQYVMEIIGIQKITSLPDMPDYIKGVINLRGKVIPIIDMRKRFRIEEIPYTDRTCFIVVDVEKINFGLIVDEVSEVMDIPEEQIDHPPATKKSGNKYIRGIGKVGKRVLILLDAKEILIEDELKEIASLV